MIIENIKNLRSKIDISLVLAKDLLIQTNGNIEQAITVFHKNNINTICRLAECDEVTAEKNYKIFNGDIEKAVKQSITCSIRLCINPNEQIDKVGFIIWGENESLDNYKTLQSTSLFIQTEDFDFVRSPFKQFIGEEGFDECGSNSYDNTTMRNIVEQLSIIPSSTNNEEEFLRKLIQWLNTKLRYADTIEVHGNQ